jgi:hypothetical protein
MLNYDVVAEGLVRLSNWWSVQGVWHCGMAFTVGPVFEEAYAVRGAIKASKVLNLGRGRDVGHSFCDRAMLMQGAVEENMYYMGYGNNISKENGLPNCSCVADASSSAVVFVDTLRAFPQTPRRSAYIKSLRKFCDYVLDKYTNSEGVIQVGILDHKRGLLPDYWCANALFVENLVGLGEITGEAKYLDAAAKVFRFLAHFDYKNTEWREWDHRSTHLVFYTVEGILSGLLSDAMKSRLACKIQSKNNTASVTKTAVVTEALNRVKAESYGSVASSAQEGTLEAELMNRWQEFEEWLFKNQQPTGVWHAIHDDRCYQMGNSWLLVWAMSGFGRNQRWEAMINRQMQYLISRDAKLNFGMFSNSFGTGCALLSYAAAAEYCQKENPERFAAAVQLASKNALENPW